MRYKEILRLKEMFDTNGIPYKFKNLLDGYQIVIISKEDSTYELCDVIEHYGSYGNQQDKLEIMGALTLEEQNDSSVLGYLTAEEVFKRFKYCYDNNTDTYKED